jgi:hypothetical protein
MGRRRLAILSGLAMLVALPGAAIAQSGGSAGVNAPANVRVFRPLQLVALRNLDFGTIVLGTLTSSQTVSVRPSGRTCGSNGQLTCSGAFSTAQYRVTGQNNQAVMIRSATPTATLTNATGHQLALTPIFPGSVTMPNSGNQGVTFEVGGSLTIAPTTPDGVYSGPIDIQVNYQ